MLTALGVLLLAAFFWDNSIGAVGSAIKAFTFGLFGWPAFFIPSAIIIAGFLIIISNRGGKVFGLTSFCIFMLFTVSSALLHTFYFNKANYVNQNPLILLVRLYFEAQKLDGTGGGGGFFGALLAMPFMSVFNIIGSRILLVVMFIVDILLLTNVSVGAFLRSAGKAVGHGMAAAGGRIRVIAGEKFSGGRGAEGVDGGEEGNAGADAEGVEDGGAGGGPEGVEMAGGGHEGVEMAGGGPDKAVKAGANGLGGAGADVLPATAASADIKDGARASLMNQEVFFHKVGDGGDGGNGGNIDGISGGVVQPGVLPFPARISKIQFSGFSDADGEKEGETPGKVVSLLKTHEIVDEVEVGVIGGYNKNGKQNGGHDSKQNGDQRGEPGGEQNGEQNGEVVLFPRRSASPDPASRIKKPPLHWSITSDGRDTGKNAHMFFQDDGPAAAGRHATRSKAPELPGASLRFGVGEAVRTDAGGEPVKRPQIKVSVDASVMRGQPDGWETLDGARAGGFLIGDGTRADGFTPGDGNADITGWSDAHSEAKDGRAPAGELATDDDVIYYGATPYAATRDAFSEIDGFSAAKGADREAYKESGSPLDAFTPAGKSRIASNGKAAGGGHGPIAGQGLTKRHSRKGGREAAGGAGAAPHAASGHGGPGRVASGRSTFGRGDSTHTASNRNAPGRDAPGHGISGHGPAAHAASARNAGAYADLPPEPYRYPPLSFLDENPDKRKNMSKIKAQTQETAIRLEETLLSFKVRAHVINVTRGPSVTLYEVQPDVGVKVSTIVNLAEDISLKLGVSGLRIAPVADRSAIGIEVPNREVSAVVLRDIVGSDAFLDHQSPLAFAVGVNISGEAVTADISKMPHLLIAGATGSGKSVCVNCLILSLLYRASPDEVKLIMIDPKVVELGVYNGIPHLMIPVVTDPRKAAGALAWAVQEMLGRYQAFSEKKVKDLTGYNAYVARTGDGERLPRIVIIIDELADLMMAAPKEVQDSICRLAQMARAAGMHLVVATQRPTVDVITGLIKSNIPSRIAFRVASQTDSRVILDANGAEKLLGKGDMLFYPVGEKKPIRVQGAFISETEVDRVIEYIKVSRDAEYDEEMADRITSGASSADDSPGDNDELLPSVIEHVVEAGQASTSMIQRKFKVGYARAARIIDQMEARGIVSGFDGSKPRQVLISKQRLYEMKF